MTRQSELFVSGWRAGQQVSAAAELHHRIRDQVPVLLNPASHVQKMIETKAKLGKQTLMLFEFVRHETNIDRRFRKHHMEPLRMCISLSASSWRR
jgi:hypothetical protein